MTEISGKSLHEIYKEDARKYKESIEKDLKAKKRNATDKLSVEKLQEQLNTAKKALTEIYNQPEDDGTISIDEYPSQIRYYARTALAAIGGDDE